MRISPYRLGGYLIDIAFPQEAIDISLFTDQEQVLAWHNRFIRHLSLFLGISLLLLSIDILQTGLVTWSRWPILAWSLALVFQWMRAPRRHAHPAISMLNGVLTSLQK